MIVGFLRTTEQQMTQPKRLSAAGLLAAAAFVTPAMAGMEATQEPGAFDFNYPDSRYLTGGYGVRAAPGPGFYPILARSAPARAEGLAGGEARPRSALTGGV
jgi:hypothetical protein